MNILIKQNKNNIKRKQKLLNDTYFNLLVNLTIKYMPYEIIHKFIKDLLAINNTYDYEEYLKTYQYEDFFIQEYLYEIYSFFFNGNHMNNMK